MKMTPTTLVPIPLEFKIACATYDLQLSEVLQLFIDHVSFYDSLSQKSDDIYRSATNTVIIYSLSLCRAHSTSFLKQREKILKYIKEVIRIAITRELTPTKKRKLCVPVVKKIYQIMERTNTKETTIILDEGITLQLKMDFCLLCEIHNCTPEEYLEHFMSQISLPETHANFELKKKPENQAMGFFQKALNIYEEKPSISAHRHLQVQFIDEIQELHLWLFIIRSFGKRVEKYRELYYRYYQQLLKATDTQNTLKK
ncbi:hypothetical protein [Pedobacter gandavensis]|uniref:hypothetical protein n=1 Tax=Pedobacter gandavensis TaxID=2679963 RepID=UPI002931281F|nr:hypothetical protein [Pedobacter gandavensis]